MGAVDGASSSQLFHQEYLRFLVIYENFYRFAKYFEIVLLGLGIVGNSFALCTMIASRKMGSPSYMYHRVLVISDLLFCVNYLCLKMVDGQATESGDAEQYVFSSWAAAYYSGVLKRVISSVCGYVSMYMTLLIALDRFAGMILYRFYSYLNRFPVARRLIMFTVVCSVTLHSWMAWIEAAVVKCPTTSNASGNGTRYTWVHIIHFSETTLVVLRAFNFYNLVVRIGSLLLLTVLSVSVIIAFVRVQRKRRMLLTFSTFRKTKTDKIRSSSLFYLMSVVVLLEYFERVPKEINRLFQLIYPEGFVVNNMTDPKLPYKSRLYYFYIFLYLYNFSKIVLNLLAVMKSSLILYCYLAFNYLFRRETFALIRNVLLLCWHRSRTR